MQCQNTHEVQIYKKISRLAALAKIMIKLQLQVYIDGEYSYLSEVDPQLKVEEYMRQIENEMSVIFDRSPKVRIRALQTKDRCDVNPSYPVSAVFGPEDFVFILRDLTEHSGSAIEPIILEIPDLVSGIAPGAEHLGPAHDMSHMDPIEPDISQPVPLAGTLNEAASQPVPVHAPTAVHPTPGAGDPRHTPCHPYCSPLAPHGVSDLVCQKCGEMRPYLPIEGQFCTELCVIRSKHGNGYMRKMKSQGLDFCSICISRYRHRKYAARQRHQCLECHRPWLILNENGLCRTCHVRLVGRPTARKRKSYE